MNSYEAPRGAPPLPKLGFTVREAFHPQLSLEEDRMGAALTSQALEEGIALIDCSAGPRTDEVERRVGAVLSARLPAGTQLVSTLVGPPAILAPLAPGSLPAPPGAGRLFGPDPGEWPADLGRGLDRCLRRLRVPQLAVGWVDWTEARCLAEPAVQQTLHSLSRESGPLPRWGLRYSARLPSGEELETGLHTRPSCIALPIHLLNAPDAMPLIESARRAQVNVVGLDPFAAGLLDGSRIREGTQATGGGPPRPVEWAKLRGEFGPVTKLGFLTRDRRRTLPQAAFEFAVGTLGVVSVLAPLRTADDLVLARDAAHALPLSPSEREQVVLGSGRRPTVEPAPAFDLGLK